MAQRRSGDDPGLWCGYILVALILCQLGHSVTCHEERVELPVPANLAGEAAPIQRARSASQRPLAMPSGRTFRGLGETSVTSPTLTLTPVATSGSSSTSVSSSSPIPTPTPTLPEPIKSLFDLFEFIRIRIDQLPLPGWLKLVLPPLAIVLWLTRSAWVDVLKKIASVAVNGIQSVVEGLKWRWRPDQAVQDELKSLSTLLHDGKYSKVADRYVEIRKIPPWDKGFAQRDLERTWGQAAPPCLIHTVNLIGDEPRSLIVCERARKIGPATIVPLLGDAYQLLDDTWKRRIDEVLFDLKDQDDFKNLVDSHFIEAHVRRRWCAVLEAWPSIKHSHSHEPEETIQTALARLGLSADPFCARQAENDDRLLLSRWDHPRYQSVKTARTVIVTGNAGAGKTALALFLAHDSLRAGSLFPVYCPVYPTAGPYRDHLDDLVIVVCETLLCYMAVTPGGFVNRRPEENASLIGLWVRYLGNRDAIMNRLQAAGPSHSAEGQVILAEIERSRDPHFTRVLSDDRLLQSLRTAYPWQFRQLMVLFDVQDDGQAQKMSQDQLQEFLAAIQRLVKCLDEQGVCVKLFLPEPFTAILAQRVASDLVVPTVSLDWQDNDLRDLLKRRITAVAKGDDMNSWYNQKEGGPLTPPLDERLIHSAQATPRGLMEKGHLLLTTIGQTGRQLESVAEVESILGAWSDTEREEQT